MISVDVAGPTLPAVMFLRPMDIRGMAAWVVRECVWSPGGMGGYVTKNLNNMISHLSDPTIPPPTVFRKFITPKYCFILMDNGKPELPSTAFITVTVSGPSQGRPRPGDLDPILPSYLSGWMYGIWSTWQLRAPSRAGRASDVARVLQIRAAAMHRGGQSPWWTSAALGTDEMAYSCDADLGSPSSVDCAQLDFQTGAASDTIQLGAGETKFLSSSERTIRQFSSQFGADN